MSASFDDLDECRNPLSYGFDCGKSLIYVFLELAGKSRNLCVHPKDFL